MLARRIANHWSDKNQDQDRKPDPDKDQDDCDGDFFFEGGSIRVRVATRWKIGEGVHR